MKRFLLAILMVAIAATAVAQEKKEYPAPEKMVPGNTEFWTPQPPVVTPGQYKASVEAPVLDSRKRVASYETVEKEVQDCYVTAPSDAIVLFDGTSLDEWVGDGTKENGWKIENGVLTITPRTGTISTKRSFGDIQLHIEWREPEDIQGKSQGRGNSGIFLQSRYEVQILDCYNNETYAAGGAGSIYKQYAPRVNAMRAPGQWNVFDIIYMAPTFREDGSFRTFPTVTVLHNGVLIQNHTMILGTTEYIGLPHQSKHGDAPIILQDHGDPVSFRNIWVREL